MPPTVNRTDPLKTACDDTHQSWPARPRYARFTSAPASGTRADTYRRDVAARAVGWRSTDLTTRALRGLGHIGTEPFVDPVTGEVVGESAS